MRKLANRKEAGKQLAAALAAYAGRKDVLILALPRGGVPVAHEVASALRVPLDIWLVRKLGVPGHEELAMGAIALGGHEYIDEDLQSHLRIPDSAVQKVRAQEMQELERRNKLYRGNRPAPVLQGKTALLIDDGVATGASTRAAILALRAAGAREIIVAVPVGPHSSCRMLEQHCDRMLCLHEPEPFYGVGMWYEDFSQTTDAEVRNLLASQTWLTGGEMIS